MAAGSATDSAEAAEGETSDDKWVQLFARLRSRGLMTRRLVPAVTTMHVIQFQRVISIACQLSLGIAAIFGYFVRHPASSLQHPLHCRIATP
jgi:hypothetical protein